METLIWNFIDKTTWGNGPWVGEPDKMQWVDQATGMSCLAVRNPGIGSWCGYVGVGRLHPWYGKDYDGIDANVHGGLTFADRCKPNTGRGQHGICHVVDKDENDDVWWLGFDCAHYGDQMPASAALFSELDKKYGTNWHNDRNSVYRTLDYVSTECARLAEQAQMAGRITTRLKSALSAVLGSED